MRTVWRPCAKLLYTARMTCIALIPLLAGALLFPGCSLSAQSPASPATASSSTDTSWAHVQALPIGTVLHVNTGRHSTLCHLRTVDTDGLACTSGATIPRTSITQIKLTRRAASTALVAGGGAVVGLIAVGATAASVGFNNGAKGSVLAAGIGLGALLFAPIGYFTDGLRGPLVYRKP